MPNFDKPTGFTMKMGSKEIYDESSPFSMRDTALMKASPMLKPLKGNQDKLPQELKQAILDSPMNKNGKDKDKDDFNYKSDMGKYNPTVTSYEGDAFVGTRGGKSQKVGSKVQGSTEGTRGEDSKFVRGTVTGPSKSSKSKQSRRVKGATYSS